MGYLEFYWNSAGEAGQAPTAAGPAGATAARQSPEAGERRHTAGKALLLNPGADPPDNSAPRSGSERILLSPCLGFLVCDLGKLRRGRQGGEGWPWPVTPLFHAAFLGWLPTGFLNLNRACESRGTVRSVLQTEGQGDNFVSWKFLGQECLGLLSPKCCNVCYREKHPGDTSYGIPYLLTNSLHLIKHEPRPALNHWVLGDLLL